MLTATTTLALFVGFPLMIAIAIFHAREYRALRKAHQATQED